MLNQETVATANLLVGARTELDKAQARVKDIKEDNEATRARLDRQITELHAKIGPLIQGRVASSEESGSADARQEEADPEDKSQTAKTE